MRVELLTNYDLSMVATLNALEEARSSQASNDFEAGGNCGLAN
jgi:hypothetical protein